MSKDKRNSVYFDRDKLDFVGLDDVVKKQLSEAYPGIDIDSELKKMSLWLCTSKGKTRKGNIGFIMNWLSNASVPTQEISQSTITELDSSLDSLFKDYRKDLWKNREHILEFNTIRR